MGRLFMFAAGRMTASGAGGFPDASNTGPQAGTSFTTTSGELSTNSNGQVIENLEHTGLIIVKHNDVIIRDCIITMDATIVGILCDQGSGRTGLVVTRCTVVGNGEFATITTENMDDFEISYCNLSNVENAIMVSSNDVNIHDNYIHDLAVDGDNHNDGVQGFPGYENLTIHHNTIISLDTSCVISGGSSAPEGGINNTIITNNRFLESAPISYGIQIKFSDVVTVTGNRFGFSVPPTDLMDFPGCTNLTVSGNVDDDTGDPVSP